MYDNNFQETSHDTCINLQKIPTFKAFKNAIFEGTKPVGT